MKYRHKIPWHQIILYRRYSSAKNPNKSHYESLEISTSATHNEVKSAFFKLSKLYHPDKNSSEEAKHIFRNISEAYEVLGNHDKRKQYDRQLRIITPISSAPSAPANNPIYRDQAQIFTQAELRKEAERVRSTYARHNSQTDTPLHYDMETWTKEHYSNLFEKTQARKRKLEKLKSNQNYDKELQETLNRESRPVFIIIVILGCLFFFEEFFAHPPDTPVNLVNKTNTDKKNEEDPKVT